MGFRPLFVACTQFFVKATGYSFCETVKHAGFINKDNFMHDRLRKFSSFGIAEVSGEQINIYRVIGRNIFAPSRSRIIGICLEHVLI